MYPEINALVDELHGRGMSTFLVTNAQFPDNMQRLKPVTQLYVSVDAATKASLKSIDRPLFGDFWERFQSCLTLLRQKRQRTVYRMTLVKEWNMKEMAEYATLVNLGEPDFVEIKGATYCGESSASGLTMKNIPYHADICAFAQALCYQTQGIDRSQCAAKRGDLFRGVWIGMRTRTFLLCSVGSNRSILPRGKMAYLDRLRSVF